MSQSDQGRRRAAATVLFIVLAIFGVTGASAQTLDESAEQLNPPVSAAANSQVGASVAGAGDLDLSGRTDLVVGAPGLGAGGAAIVYLGSDDFNERATPDIIFTGEATGDQAGISVAGGFNFNGDAYPDLLIGADQAGGTGKVYLIYFRPSDYPNINNPNVPDLVSLSDVGGNIPGVVFLGEAGGDQAGFSVAGGKFNVTGPDILIGAPGADPTVPRNNAGRAYVIFNNPALVSPVNLGNVGTSVVGVMYNGEVEDDELGSAVAFVGNVVGDGGYDIALGAPGYDVGGAINEAGATYLPPGGTVSNGIVEVCDIVDTGGGGQINGDTTGERSGSSLGFGSLLIGAPPYGASAGRVLHVTQPLAPGQTIAASNVGVTITGTKFEGAAAGDQLGKSVAGIGDSDGNGINEIVLGAPFHDGPGAADGGAVYQIETSPDLPATVNVAAVGGTVVGRRLTGAEAGEQAGSAVAQAVDFNGDTLGDFAVGSPGRDAISTDTTDIGVVHFVPGSQRAIVPTMGEWMMILFALLLALAAVMLIRRRLRHEGLQAAR